MRINSHNLLALAIASLMCVDCFGQQRVRVLQPQAQRIQIGLIDDVSTISQGDSVTGEGATLKTDPDLESILKKSGSIPTGRQLLGGVPIMASRFAEEWRHVVFH